MSGANNEPSFQDILQFDPFEDGPDTADPPEGQETQQAGEENAGEEQVEDQQQVDQGGQQQQPPAQQPPVAQQPVTPPAQPPMSAADMANLFRQQTEAIRAAVTPPAPSPQGGQQQQKFNLGVPDELVTALRSEDPAQFKQGLAGLVNGISNHLWNTFQASMRDEFAPAVRQMIESHTSASREQENVGRDFYGTYPMLNSPLMTQMVQTAGQMVGSEWQAAGKPLTWGPEMRDAIAEKIFQVLPHLRPQQQQQNNQPRRNGRFTTGTGARPGTQPTPQDEMVQMIFGGGG